MPKFLLVIFFTLLSFALRAQSWEVGAAGGGAGYMGDLNQTNPFKVSGASYGGFVQYNFNGYLTARLAYNIGNIAGADSTSSDQQTRSRNLSFINQLNEVSIVGQFNFMKYIPSISESRYTPYIFVGIGIVGYSPQANYNGRTYDLRLLQTEGERQYNEFAISIPYGAGVKYNVIGAWTLGAEVGYRNPNTDYLDDVSGVYADKTKIANPISLALSDRSGERTGTFIGAAGTQRGDLRPRDTYFFMNFTISYTFITQKCYY